MYTPGYSHRKRQANNRKSSYGRSLIEVLVTVAIAGTFAGVGIPSFQGWIAGSRMVTGTNNLIRDLHFARTVAITLGADVVVCESVDHESCTYQRDWSGGWIVFADANGNQQRDEPEKILTINTGFPGTVTFRAQGRYGYRYLTYRANGRAKNGTFTLCDRQGNARAVVVYLSGRPRIAYTQANGDPLVCPSV